MRKLLIAALLSQAVPLHARKYVTMFVDDRHVQQVKREQLDCSIHKNKKKSLSLGFKFSVAFAAKVGPEVTFGRSTEIQWNDMSQELIRRYEELCDFHNKGHLTVAEFDRRYARLDEQMEKAVKLKKAIRQDVFAHAEKAFDDLEEEEAKLAGRAGFKDKMKEKIQTYAAKVDDLNKEVKAEEEPAEKEKPAEN